VKREISSNKGPRGKGSLRTYKNNIKITTPDGDVHEISKENIGKGINVMADDNLYFELSPGGTWLYQLRPWSGTFYVKFKWFPHKEDGVPEYYLQEGGPRTNPKTGQSWVAKDRLSFSAEFEIVEGKYKGMTIRQYFDYLFDEDDDGMAKLVGSGKAAKRLDEFLRLAGGDFEIEYSHNILPGLMKILKSKRSQFFMVKVDEGKIQETFDTPEGYKPSK